MIYNKGTAIPTYIYGIICELATMGYIDENQTLNADFLNKVHIEELIDLDEIGKEVKRRLGGQKMDCETDDCRKEKRGCKGCFYSDGKEDEDINPEIIKIIKYCRARECDECKYNINDEICALHNPSAWNV